MSASCKLLANFRERIWNSCQKLHFQTSWVFQYSKCSQRAIYLHSIILRKVHSSWLSSATCWVIEKLISETQNQQHHGVRFDQRKQGLSCRHSCALRHKGRRQLRSEQGGRSFAISLGFPGEIPIDNVNGSCIQLFWEWNWLKLWEFGQQIAILHNKYLVIRTEFTDIYLRRVSQF